MQPHAFGNAGQQWAAYTRVAADDSNHSSKGMRSAAETAQPRNAQQHKAPSNARPVAMAGHSSSDHHAAANAVAAAGAAAAAAAGAIAAAAVALAADDTAAMAQQLQQGVSLTGSLDISVCTCAWRKLAAATCCGRQHACTLMPMHTASAATADRDALLLVWPQPNAHGRHLLLQLHEWREHLGPPM